MSNYYLCNTLLVAIDDSVADKEDFLLSYALLYDLVMNKAVDRFSDISKWNQERNLFFSKSQFLLDNNSSKSRQENVSLEEEIKTTASESGIPSQEVMILDSLMESFENASTSVRTELYKSINKNSSYIGELAVFYQESDTRIRSTICTFSMKRDESSLFRLINPAFTTSFSQYSVKSDTLSAMEKSVIDKVSTKKDKIIKL